MRIILTKIDIYEKCFKNKADYFLAEIGFLGRMWKDLLCKDCAKEQMSKIRQDKLGVDD